MKSVSDMLSSPLYAAIIGVVFGIVAKMIDSKMSDTKGTFTGYFKSAAYSAALLAFWTFVTGRITDSPAGPGAAPGVGGVGANAGPGGFVGGFRRAPQPFGAPNY